MMVQYFNDIFKSSPWDLEPVLNCIESKVSEAQNENLLRRMCLEEVKMAIFNMYPDKSPGPDGLSPRFYQSFWDIMGQ